MIMLNADKYAYFLRRKLRIFFFICIFLIVSRNTIIFYVIPKVNMFNKNPEGVVCAVVMG